MGIGKTDNYKFYEGYEDEPEVEISADNMETLHIWDGFIMDIFCEMCANVFHFLFCIRIAVWNPVDDLIQIIMFFNDIKTCTEIDITEISNIGYPVIHFGYTVRGINALIFEYSVINDRSDLLCTNFFA